MAKIIKHIPKKERAGRVEDVMRSKKKQNLANIEAFGLSWLNEMLVYHDCWSLIDLRREHEKRISILIKIFQMNTGEISISACMNARKY